MSRPASRGLPVLVIACAAAPLLILALTGCVKRAVDADEKYRADPAIHLDRATGCEYLSVGNSSIAPRMGADGKQICRGVRDPEPTAQRERAASMAAKRGGGVA